MNETINLAATLCREFEGFRAEPYLCPAGVPTIGYGATHYPDGRKVTMKDPTVTKTEAEEMLKHELEHVYLAAIRRQCPEILDEHPQRIAAILDWVYNLGESNLQASTLRKKLKVKDWPGACTELLRWTKGPGGVLPGLVRRREAEIEFIMETL